MQPGRAKQFRLMSMLGLWLAHVPVARLVEWRQSALPMRARTLLIAPAPPHSPFDASLQEAKRSWGEAQIVIKPDLERLAEREPYAQPGAEEQWRRQLMSRDRGGNLLA